MQVNKHTHTILLNNGITINPSSIAFDIEWLVVIHPCVLNDLVECQKHEFSGNVCNAVIITNCI